MMDHDDIDWFFCILNVLCGPFMTICFFMSILAFYMKEKIGQGLAARGKIRKSPSNYITSSSNDNTSSSIKPSSYMTEFFHGSTFCVRKSLFTYFYIIGILSWMITKYKIRFTIIIKTTTITSPPNTQTTSCTMSSLDHIILYLFGIHLIRRLYECFYVHKFGTSSQMHIFTLIFGSCYYIFMPATLVPLPCNYYNNYSSNNNLNNSIETTITPKIIFITFITCFFNLLFQYKQHQHHVILASLRSESSSSKLLESNNNMNKKGNNRTINLPMKNDDNESRNSHNNSNTDVYKIPMDGWFQYISSPHYFFEIMMYITLGILVWMDRNNDHKNNNNNPLYKKDMLHHDWLLWMYQYRYWLALAFIITNLSYTANENHIWYQQRYGQAYIQLNRKRIIPFIL